MGVDHPRRVVARGPKPVVARRLQVWTPDGYGGGRSTVTGVDAGQLHGWTPDGYSPNRRKLRPARRSAELKKVIKIFIKSIIKISIKSFIKRRFPRKNFHPPFFQILVLQLPCQFFLPSIIFAGGQVCFPGPRHSSARTRRICGHKKGAYGKSGRLVVWNRNPD